MFRTDLGWLHALVDTIAETYHSLARLVFPNDKLHRSTRTQVMFYKVIALWPKQ